MLSYIIPHSHRILKYSIVTFDYFCVRAFLDKEVYWQYGDGSKDGLTQKWWMERSRLGCDDYVPKRKRIVFTCGAV